MFLISYRAWGTCDFSNQLSLPLRFHCVFLSYTFVIISPSFRIIATLEKLKQEAAEITRKVEETDVVMAEVEAVSEQYSALSHYCSSIYFTMEGLNLVSKTPNSYVI